MDDHTFPWINTPDEVAEKVNGLIEEWQDEVANVPNESEQRLSAQRLLRRIVHETFMAHFASTEEDFERCWPRLRDDILCEHAAQIFNEIFGIGEYEDWDDYEDGFVDDEFDDELEDDGDR
ncbi:MAG: hypothetical protein LC754_04955 [Acidobacteria bacterium]|nr:hypothetical protein [Acidobacteriota bacterium]